MNEVKSDDGDGGTDNKTQINWKMKTAENTHMESRN